MDHGRLDASSCVAFASGVSEQRSRQNSWLVPSRCVCCCRRFDTCVDVHCQTSHLSFVPELLVQLPLSSEGRFIQSRSAAAAPSSCSAPPCQPVCDLLQIWQARARIHATLLGELRAQPVGARVLEQRAAHVLRHAFCRHRALFNHHKVPVHRIHAVRPGVLCNCRQRNRMQQPLVTAGVRHPRFKQRPCVRSVRAMHSHPSQPRLVSRRRCPASPSFARGSCKSKRRKPCTRVYRIHHEIAT